MFTLRLSREAAGARRVGQVLLIASALVAPATVAAGPVASAVGTDCPTVLVIGARGSGESAREEHGLGAEVGYFYDSLPKAPGVKLKRLALPYSAAPVDVLQPTKSEVGALLAGGVAAAGVVGGYKPRHIDPYLASISEGRHMAVDALGEMAAQCPSAKFILAGYSQGAMVMHQALTVLLSRSSSALLGRIIAVALIADPLASPGSSVQQLGTAPVTHQGVVSNVTDLPSQVARFTYSVCEAGDFVCDTPWKEYKSGPLGAIRALRGIRGGVRVHKEDYKREGASRGMVLLAKAIARRTAAAAPPAQVPSSPVTSPTSPVEQTPPNEGAPPGGGTPSSPTAGTHDCSAFAGDVTVPDGTPVASGQVVTKSWSLSNCGDRSWGNLRAVRTAGIYGPDSFPVPDAQPGQTVTVTASVAAPQVPGVARATYRLQNVDGSYADNEFWVELNVSTPVSGTTTTFAHHVYHTCANGHCGLNARPAPTYVNQPVTRVLTDGSLVNIVCQTRGEVVGGVDGSSSPVWDRLAEGDWVADFYIDTPGVTGTFSPPIPSC